MSTDKLRRRYC